MRALQFVVGAALAALLVRERRTRQRAERFAAAGLESLLRAIDANDQQTGRHVRRVADYALIIADAVDVDETERRTIELAALFHDIGKIHEALFDIVHEPGKLTPGERRAIATHPARGAEVLAPIANFHPELADAVLAHHERWDGTGYPRHLRGGNIPRAARIVSLADTFDVVTHTRRYRDGRTVEQAMQVILEGRATQFDPVIVDLLLLPPVFQRLKRAHRRWARGGNALRNRGEVPETEKPINVQIRWRSHTESPARVKQKLADSR